MILETTVTKLFHVCRCSLIIVKSPGSKVIVLCNLSMALLGPPREHCVTPARAAAKETTWSLDIGETLCLVSVFHQGCSYNSGGLLSRRLYIYSFYVQNLQGGNETAISVKSRITIAKITCCFLFVPITPNYDFRNAKKKLLLQKPRTDYLKRS